MNEICACLNLPGKTGVDGSMVTDFYDKGDIKTIRDYCETDVINTYLLYLHFQHFSGSISPENFAKSKEEVAKFLKKNQEKEYLKEFLTEWQSLDERV
jgi:predicted PolB exonuclease-like 3'-5' exonuclease